MRERQRRRQARGERAQQHVPRTMSHAELNERRGVGYALSPTASLPPSPVLSVPSDSPSLSLSSLFSLARSLFRRANPLAPPSPAPLPSLSLPSFRHPTSSTARFALSSSSSLLASRAYIACTFPLFPSRRSFFSILLPPLSCDLAPPYRSPSLFITPLALTVYVDGIYIYIYTLRTH